MFLELENVLTPPEVGHLQALAAKARFVEGRHSNPHSKVKNNQQIDQTDAIYAESSRLMAVALQRNEALRDFALPRLIAPPLMARYRSGMNYGVHSDAPVMALPTGPLRSDLSCTLFLNDPYSYQGGELSVHLGGRRLDFKGAPGSAIVYPSDTLHEVLPIQSGERLVGLTFIQSYVGDSAEREVLYQLNEVAALEGLNMSWDNRTRLQYARDKLLRMWSSS